MIFKSDGYEILTDIDAAIKSSKINASHIMYVAKCDKKHEFEPYMDWQKNYVVLMHLRFDGSLGFPGGLFNAGEDSEDALFREVIEEHGLNKEELKPVRGDYYYSSVMKASNLAAHFYVKEIPYKLFVELECSVTKAEHFGLEVFGSIRVPLYQYKNDQGFPRFLKNQMIGCCRDQLLNGLLHHNILDKNIFDSLCQSTKDLM